MAMAANCANPARPTQPGLPVRSHTTTGSATYWNHRAELVMNPPNQK